VVYLSIEAGHLAAQTHELKPELTPKAIYLLFKRDDGCYAAGAGLLSNMLQKQLNFALMQNA
jgi:hypothetical protein